MIGRRAFTWHGDTPAGARRRFLKAPADVLLTTPESLEVMLISPKVPARRLFAGLRAVVIDDAIGIRLMGYHSLAFDHRVVDGAVGDQFMALIKHQLEHWDPSQA